MLTPEEEAKCQLHALLCKAVVDALQELYVELEITYEMAGRLVPCIVKHVMAALDEEREGR